MRRIHVALLFSLALVLATAAPALAGYGWCPDDPVLDIEGTTVSIETRLPADRLADLKGPVELQVRVPDNVKVKVVSISNNYFQEVVTIKHTGRKWDGRSPIPVTAEMEIDSGKGKPMPVQLEASGSGLSGDLFDEGKGKAHIKFEVPPARG